MKFYEFLFGLFLLMLYAELAFSTEHGGMVMVAITFVLTLIHGRNK